MLAISVSYGNDSIAMLQWAKETGQQDVVAVYCDTGWASPSWGRRRADIEDEEEGCSNLFGCEIESAT